ncbi:MAG: helix-turn-helix domain-containing protein, partial [Candidatus Puniceispirillaceae bacterium]
MAIIDPRHLLQFHEIIRTGSFTRAAETLGLTQPALTRNMKVMEGRLGFEVLVRSRQRIVP